MVSSPVSLRLRSFVFTVRALSRIRSVTLISLCLFGAIYFTFSRVPVISIQRDPTGHEIRVNRGVSDEVVSGAKGDFHPPAEAVLVKFSKPAAGAEDAGLQSFYSSIVEKSLIEWEQKKLWFYKTLFSQRQHFQFQCYVSRKHQFKLCTSPKVSSSVWKAVFCELNGHEPSRCGSGTLHWNEPGLSKSSTHVDESKATIVLIVRDPLERLVSAYFDKCVRDSHRTGERHCHPREIMLTQSKEYFLKPETFAEWVDMLGHHWDEHVLPQCVENYFPKGGVPYSPQPYTHVIQMDENYLKSIEVMLESAQLMTREEKYSILSKFNRSVAKRPALSDLRKRYLKYYSKSTVTRALQYYAPDYTCLKLPLPEWLLSVA